MKKVNIISTVVARGQEGKGTAAGGNRIFIQGETVDVQALKDEVLLEVAKRYLSKIYDDTSKGIINFANGMKIADALLNKVIGLNDPSIATDRSVMTGARILHELEELLKRADKRYIRKDQQDETDYLVRFFDGLEAGLYVYGGTLGSKLHKDGTVEAGKFVSNGEAKFRSTAKSEDYAEGSEGWAAKKGIDGKWTYETDQILARVLGDMYDLMVRNHATFAGSLSSEEFVSGFGSGKGWAIRLREYINSAGVKEYRSVAEFDDLIVRGTMRVTEFVVNQLLGENDNRVFSGMAEVEYYDAEADILYIQTRGGKLWNPFRVDDVIVVQQFGGMPTEENESYVTKAYEFVVKEVGIGDVAAGEDRLDWLRFENFTSPMEGATLALIQKGDTLVRWDNLSDDRRKGLITINAVGEDTPFIDIIKGAKTDPDNALKGRLGNLGGIYHPLFGWLPDFGAYLSNLYAVGEFVIAHSGENVADSIKIAKGSFRTNFRQSQYDLTEESNYLKNATFTNNCESWVLGGETTEYFLVDDMPQFFNFDLLSTEDSFAGIADYNGRDMLRLSNSTAMQLNADIRKPGTHKEFTGVDADGQPQSKDVPDKLYLNLRVYCKNAGTLNVGFANGGTYIANTFRHTLTMTESVDAYTISLSGVWDGAGDFLMSATGEVYVDLVSLTDKPLDNFKVEMETAIEQTAAGIALIAKKQTATDASLAQIRVDMDGISSTVASVSGTAANAVSVAAAAKTAAQGAVSAASDAQTAADDAKTAADNATAKATANATAIEQTKSSISMLAGAFTQKDGKYVLTEAAGVLITDKMATLYATKSSVTDLSGRVSATESSISQLRVDVNGISSTVSSVKGTADDAKSVAAAAEAVAASAATKATAAATAAETATAAAETATAAANNAASKANTNATAIAQNKSSISLLAGAFTTKDGKYVLTEAAGVVITDKMATLYATKASVDNLGNRVTSAESSISVNATEIASKVSKNGVISAINQSAESIKISASKIELTGEVTFSMLDTSTQNTINGKATQENIDTSVNTLKDSLGSLAYKSSVGKAQLDNTIISGGYILTSLIDASKIRAQIVESASTYGKLLINGGEMIVYDKNGNENFSLITGSNYTLMTIGNAADKSVTIHPSDISVWTAKGANSLNDGGLSLCAGSSIKNLTLGNISSTMSNTVDFLVTSSAFTLPSANTCKGKVLFVKMLSGVKVTSSSLVYNGGDSTTWTTKTYDGARAVIFVSNGTSWYEYRGYQ